MKKTIIILIISIGLIFLSYSYFDMESLELNDTIRQIEGDFTKTTHGYVHYEKISSGNSPYIILIHGYSSPMEIWDFQVPVLKDSGFNILRYDLFGRGFSDRPDVEYSLDLALFLSFLNLLNLLFLHSGLVFQFLRFFRK